MRFNLATDTDARVRPLLLAAPSNVHRSFLRLALGDAMRYIALLTSAMLLAGCAPAPVKMYAGAERSSSEQVVLSSIGLYPQRSATVLVTKINGEQPPSITHAAEYLLLPGEYSVSLQIRATQYFTREAPSQVVVDVTVPLKAEAGHTYIPNISTAGNKLSAIFDDKGLSYRRECLPLYTQAAFYGTPQSNCK
jgi:hypothetical protein